ncbi:FAD-dependent oxidoreductase [Jeotgalibaca sp. MA1X17-3]|uniref:protoporphyrinogen/coproporphyrinogen oxidase n=1 Tax=Jeotgalibaca sp. MA1X17-3 TaxID=2908211 RepID=UPI001F2B5ACC|nr:FAD-dependent oxidoreductase [Jeotgalibaca sp. MA1X17-3]UJF15169.1 FAD-dependent oxidoreductase [Jeotgalibaca sp. MA1X17-3]
MERAKNRIAVIGGGISGLTAAYEINKAIQKEKLPFNFILLERRNKIGGMVKTIEMEGHSIDVGAASFDIRREDIRPFLEELGLSAEIQYSISGKSDRYNGHDFIYNEKPTYHGVPIRRTGFLHDRGLTLHDKLKVIINGSFHKQKKSETYSISTSQFLEYRLCKEAATFIAYPHYPENIYGSMELCPPNFFDPNLIDLFEYSDEPLNNIKEKIEPYKDKPGNEFNLLNGMRVFVDRLKQQTEAYIETGKQVTGMEMLDQGLVLLKVNETEEIRVGSVISSIPLTESHQILDKRWKESELIPKPIVSSMCTILFQFKKERLLNFQRGMVL